MTRRAGMAGLAAIGWAALMALLLAFGPVSHAFPNRFPRHISVPVLALELARSPADVDAVLGQPRDPGAVRALTANTLLDLIFIPLYTLYLIYVARVYGIGETWLPALIAAAGLFDYVENACMFAALSGGPPYQSRPSLIKWDLLGISLAVTGAGMLRRGRFVYCGGLRIPLGLLQIGAGALMLFGVGAGNTFGYAALQYGSLLFGVTMLANSIALLGARGTQAALAAAQD